MNKPSRNPDGNSTTGTTTEHKYLPEFTAKKICHRVPAPTNNDTYIHDGSYRRGDIFVGDENPLLSEYMPGELPPDAPYLLIPEKLDIRHAIAYIYAQSAQLGSEVGIKDLSDIATELTGWMDFETEADAAEVCRETISWTQSLKPRERKPFIWSLLTLLKDSLHEGEIRHLMDDLKRLSELEIDRTGNIARFIQSVFCFIYEKRNAIPTSPFYYLPEESNALPDDPECWTIAHDLITLSIYLSQMKSEGLTEPDKLILLLHFPNWFIPLGGDPTGFQYMRPNGALDLLDEVGRELFPNGLDQPHLPRIEKSHRNLLGYYDRGEVSEDDCQKFLRELYRVTLNSLALSFPQKLRLKELFLVWNEFVDLHQELRILDYTTVDGIEIFGALDYPLDD